MIVPDPTETSAWRRAYGTFPGGVTTVCALRDGAPVGIAASSVKAFVSLGAGASATPEEIAAFTKERMTAYKYPRQVEVLDEIPKTVSGKVLRRELRKRS
ncbi:hypothetical protein GCM10023215_58940 [Pseudonocardia yuanmonensis]|uniref:AMP-binding enzyme C-terminal domain-containing protein n=1 Tax=Pseudonocardia yuanmonensis TaxID=1095914 RepID=A0ABP8XM52_9PSEU